jgi:hypothetical protein
MNCKDLLEPDAVACVECGTLVGQRSDGASPDPHGQPLPATRTNQNTFSYHEDRNGKTFTGSFSNEAVDSMGGSLAEFFAYRAGAPRPALHRHEHQEIVIEDRKALPPGEPTQVPAPVGAPPPPAPSATETDDKSRIGKLFRENGQTLNLIDRRLKAKNGQAFMRRLTYLFLYAHELHGRFAVPRPDVIAVLKEGKIWDSNASRWLNQKIGFKIDAEERMELLGEGRDEAKKYLIEALDPNIPDEWTPDKKGTQKRAPRKPKQ